MSRLRTSHLGQAWLVLVLAIAFGGTLAAVHTGLDQRIEANKRNETLSRIPELVLGAQLDFDARVTLSEGRIVVDRPSGGPLELEASEQELAGHQVFRVADATDGALLGWVARGAGQGYADQIEVLIGLDPQATELTGLFVLSQKETPALGDGITRTDFRRRFVGAPTDQPVEVTQSASAAESSPSRVLALTAATISSRSVCDIVNRTVTEVREGIEE